MFDSYFFNSYFLFFNSIDVYRVICHICFHDEIISSQVMLLLKSLLKNEFYFFAQLEEIILNICEVFDLNDGLNQIRLNTFFDFNKDDDDNSLNKYYYDKRNNFPKITLRGIYILAQMMQRNNEIDSYIMEHKNKVKWINDFYAEVIVNVEENNYIFNGVKKYIEENPGILDYIQKAIINKLE